MAPEAKAYHMKCKTCFECPCCQCVMALRAVTQASDSGAASTSSSSSSPADKVGQTVSNNLFKAYFYSIDVHVYCIYITYLNMACGIDY